jgi:hypothetical protein
MRRSFLAPVVALALVAGAANAMSPPPIGSEDWELMHPFSEWLRTQYNGHRPGGWCCDLGDARPVQTRTRDGHVQAFLARAKFGPTAPDDWVDVPESAYVVDPATGIRAENPVNVPVLWFNPWANQIQCFIDVAGG